MLCVYLYERLPQYLAQKSIEFVGPLHATVVRKVKIALLLSFKWLLIETKHKEAILLNWHWLRGLSPTEISEM